MTAPHPTLSEVDAQIDILDRAEPTQNPIHWRRSFEFLKVALERARRIRRFLIPPALIVAAFLVLAFHGEAWDLMDVKLAIGAFVIALALGQLALATVFAALKREFRIAALLRYYGAEGIDNDMALME